MVELKILLCSSFYAHIINIYVGIFLNISIVIYDIINDCCEVLDGKFHIWSWMIMIRVKLNLTCKLRKLFGKAYLYIMSFDL